MSCCRWLLLESIVGTSQVGVNRPDVPNGLDTVEFTMQVAANNSQTTARVFAHGINSTLALQPEQGMLLTFCCLRSSAYQCQKLQMHHFKIIMVDVVVLLQSLSPMAGVYNEEAFAGLDYIIERAGFYGIKLILTFSNEWTTADSKINYLEWGNATDNSNSFFTDATIQQYYKDHINTMVNRNVSLLMHKPTCPLL